MAREAQNSIEDLAIPEGARLYSLTLGSSIDPHPEDSGAIIATPIIAWRLPKVVEAWSPVKRQPNI